MSVITMSRSCPKCHWTQQYSGIIKGLPNVLVLALERTDDMGERMSTPVTIDTTLTLKDASGQHTKYNLQGIIVREPPHSVK